MTSEFSVCCCRLYKTESVFLIHGKLIYPRPDVSTLTKIKNTPFSGKYNSVKLSSTHTKTHTNTNTHARTHACITVEWWRWFSNFQIWMNFLRGFFFTLVITGDFYGFSAHQDSSQYSYGSQQSVDLISSFPFLLSKLARIFPVDYHHYYNF